MKTKVIAVLSAESMTGTSTINSSPIALDQIYGFAVQAYWSGTPTGTIKLQASCDAPNGSQVANGGPDTVTHWDDISGSSIATGGAAGTATWNINGAFYRWVRISYTNASGTGTLSANICIKGA